MRYASSGSTDSANDIQIDADKLGLVGYAGDTFTVRAKNLHTTSVVVRVTLNWEEI